MEANSKLDLAVQEIQFIKQFITEDRKRYDEHVNSSQEFRDKVIIHEEKLVGIRTELFYIRWILGMNITVGLALIAKLMTMH